MRGRAEAKEGIIHVYPARDRILHVASFSVQPETELPFQIGIVFVVCPNGSFLPDIHLVTERWVSVVEPRLEIGFKAGESCIMTGVRDIDAGAADL